MYEEPLNPTVVTFSQSVPPKPVAQVQVKLLFCKSQVPLLRQGLGMHEDNLSSQRLPVKFAGHAQLKSAMESLHVALFWHGLDAHSSMSMEQFVPERKRIKSFKDGCNLFAN